jgi:dCTP deaminase
MLLSHQELHRRLSQDTALDDRIWVTPLLDADLQIGPASIDVRLGTSFAVFRRIHAGILDAGSGFSGERLPGHERFECPVGESFLIHPLQFVLAITLEYIRLPNDLAAHLSVRSAWSRLGLVVGTSTLLQPGFTGCVTLEVINHGSTPLRLYPGSRIAQLAFERLDQPTLKPHQNRYVGAIGPELSKIPIQVHERDQMEEIRYWLDRIGTSEQPSDEPESGKL